MFKRKLAMILALSTIMASLGSINVNADDTIGTSSEGNKPSVIDVIELKQYLTSDIQLFFMPPYEYDYNGDQDINYLDLLALKKEILGINEVIEPISVAMTPIKEIDELDQTFKDGVLDFSVNFFKTQVAESKNGENVMISPQSLYFALGMTVNGTAGKTQEEIINTLCNGVSVKDFNNNTAYLINQNNTKNCKIANSIWVKECDDLSLNKDFQDYSEKYFNSEVYTQPFDEQFVTDVNNWVDRNTDSMIEKLLEEVPNKNCVAHLINAICFKADWEKKYDSYDINEDGTFFKSNGEKQTVTMLNSEEDVYLYDDNAQGFLKYYDGGKYAFMGILPNSDVSIEEYMNNLTGESFSNLYNNQVTENMKLNVGIPEFTCEDKYILNDTLKSLGVNTAFDEHNADFHNMLTSTDPFTNFYISDVIQKTFIQVDRNGTKAAAVTDIAVNEATSVGPTIPHYYVYLNKPFIYAIVDTETELPIFMGTINSIQNPNE